MIFTKFSVLHSNNYIRYICPVSLNDCKLKINPLKKKECLFLPENLTRINTSGSRIHTAYQVTFNTFK